MFVLIIIIYGAYGSTGITAAEFDSQANCERAANAVIEKAAGSTKSITAFCAAK